MTAGPPRPGQAMRDTRPVPPRTRRRVAPRPAPVVAQDSFTEQALHQRPAAGKSGKSATNGSARKSVPPEVVVEAETDQLLNGHDHSQLAPPRPAPRRPGLIPTDIADTIGPVIGKAIADIKAHEDGSRRGGDIEDVHKMRVATRRVRAYLKAARPALDRVATDRLRADVRELAGTLGVIRDTDGMIHPVHTEDGRLGDPDTGALEHLITRLDTERIAGRDTLISELDDPSYAALLVELEEAAQQPP